MEERCLVEYVVRNAEGNAEERAQAEEGSAGAASAPDHGDGDRREHREIDREVADRVEESAGPAEQPFALASCPSAESSRSLPVRQIPARAVSRGVPCQ